MNIKQEKKYVDFFFRTGLFLKGIHAAIELVSGIVLIFVTQDFVIKLAEHLTQDELEQDPRDWLANSILHWAHYFSVDNKVFIVLYLLSHGLVKLFLVYALLKKKLWAYPLSYIVLGSFIVYQIYRYSYTHSIWLIVLTVFDLVVIWLIWKEYTYMKRKIRLQ